MIEIRPSMGEVLKTQKTQTASFKSPYVFLNTKGKPCRQDSLRWHWVEAMKKSGLPFRRMYETRHTFASWALARGETPEWVARTLGHVDTSMVYRTYSRFIPNLTRQDGSAFEGIFQKSKQKSTMKDILSIATAATDFALDNGEWTINQSGDIDPSCDFVQAITPFYIKFCPVVDHWGEAYKVYVGIQIAVRNIQPDDVGPDDFLIESFGRDENDDGWVYDPADTEDDYYTVDSWPAFKFDIVNWNGSWLRAPRVALPAGN